QHPVAAADFLYAELHGFVAQRVHNLRRFFFGDQDAKFAVGRRDVFTLKLVAVLREVQRDFLDVAFVDLGGEFAIAGSVLARGLPVGGNQAPEHDPQEYDGNPQENRFSRGTGIHFTLAVNPEPGKDSKTLEAPLAPLLGRPPRLATPLR